MFKHMRPRKGDLSILEKPAPIGFIFEPKFDSIRVFLYKEKDNIAIVNEKNIDILFKFPEMLDLPLYIDAENCVLDGMLVVFKDKKANSSLLQERDLAETQTKIRVQSKKNPATLLVFDILEINRAILTNEVLKKRREILEKIIKNSDLISLCPSSLNGKAMWEEVKEKDYEGIIAKSLTSKYWQKRSWDWLEIKNFETANVIITGMTEKTFLLATYKNNGILYYVGELQKENQKENKIFEKYIKTKIKKLGTKEKPFTLPFGFEIEKANWLKPEIVIKVKHEGLYQGVLKNPQLIRIRLDKPIEQCMLDENESLR